MSAVPCRVLATRPVLAQLAGQVVAITVWQDKLLVITFLAVNRQLCQLQGRSLVTPVNVICQSRELSTSNLS